MDTDEMTTLAVNASTAIIKRKPNTGGFLTLPMEIRFEIYGYLIEGKGVINVWARKSRGLYTDRTTIALLHSSRLIRTEVEEFFYQVQTFQFRSIPAFKSFFRRTRLQLLSRVRFIDLGWWLCYTSQADYIAKLGRHLKYFTSLERIHLSAGESWWNRPGREHMIFINESRNEWVPQSAIRVLGALTTVPNLQSAHFYCHTVAYCPWTAGRKVGSDIYIVPNGKELSDLKCRVVGALPKYVPALKIKLGMEEWKQNEVIRKELAQAKKMKLDKKKLPRQ